MVKVHSRFDCPRSVPIEKSREAAKTLGVSVMLTGESAGDGEPGWMGWIWEHAGVRSEDAYEEEYDALQFGLVHAAMRALDALDAADHAAMLRKGAA